MSRPPVIDSKQPLGAAQRNIVEQADWKSPPRRPAIARFSPDASPVPIIAAPMPAHHGAYVGEVQIDQAVLDDQVHNAGNARVQHLIGAQKRVGEGGFFVGDAEQVLIRDDNQRVDILAQLGNAGFSDPHPPRAFEGERLGDDANDENAHFLGDPRDHGSSVAPVASQVRSATASFGAPAGSKPPTAITQGAVAPAGPRPPTSAAQAVPLVTKKQDSEDAISAASSEMEGKLSGMGLTPAQIEGVLALSREVIERVVWEVVPDLAETIIREEIKRLTQ